MKNDTIYSKCDANQWGLAIYRVTPVVEMLKFWPKITSNIVNMPTTSQFGPLDNTKYPKYICRAKHDGISLNVLSNSGW